MQLAQTLSTQASVFAEPVVMIRFKKEKRKRHNAAEDALGLRLQMRKQGPPPPLSFLARSLLRGGRGGSLLEGATLGHLALLLFVSANVPDGMTCSPTFFRSIKWNCVPDFGQNREIALRATPANAQPCENRGKLGQRPRMAAPSDCPRRLSSAVGPQCSSGPGEEILAPRAQGHSRKALYN